ncbi:MAG: hypothetical protein JO000_13600 [Alphaproteobacteria bacterium]|nr:hypothetical protein [Alphaproteobacteria bacterium]
MSSLRLTLVLGFLFCAPPVLAQQVFPPGSRIGILPPPGMTMSHTFQGFEDRERNALIVVTDLAAESYGRLEQEFGEERMRAGGMELIARENVETASGPALLVGARQVQNGTAMRKWALLGLVPGEMTVAVIATLPDAVKDAYPDAALRASLMTLRIRDRLSTEDLLAVLPYRVKDLAGFRPLRASLDGTAEFTFGPRNTPLPAEQPYFIVATRVAALPPPAERDRFAQRMLMAFGGRLDLHIVSSEAIRVGAVAGHEIVTESKDDKTGDDYVSVQWLLFGTNGFAQMIGIARKDQWSAVLPRMRALRDGFEPK